MNTKQITFSLITATLLSVSASAATDVGDGNLTLTAGAGASTTEYIAKYGHTDSYAIGSMEYVADIRGSGSVSDALIRLDLTDTNLTDTDNAGFVEGVSAIQRVDTNETIAVYDKKITVDGRNYFLFDGDATTSVVSGQQYKVVDDKDTNATSTISYKFVSGSEVKLDVWSTSGSEEKRDEATGSVTTSQAPQFTVKCVSKFDGLVNFEDMKDSFVTTNHDNTIASNATDGYGQSDTFVFTIDNQRGTGKYLEGNLTTLTFFAANSDGTVNTSNEFNNTAIWSGSLMSVDENGAKVDDGNITYSYNATDANLSINFDNRTIPSGLTTYYATLTHTADQNVTINATKFVGASLNLEAGMADGNDSIAPAGNIGNPMGTDLGEWRDHAYVAQIAGATQKEGVVISKFFIVNRSCTPVIPTFKLIQNGKVTMIEGSSIPVDSQSKIKMATLLSSTEAQEAGLAEGQYAVEIILPGIAEDFYVYAQSLTADGATKDLPVYSTSTRD